jgi:hypothetical protein
MKTSRKIQKRLPPTGQVVNWYIRRQDGREKPGFVTFVYPNWGQFQIQILVRLCRHKVLYFCMENILQVGNKS